MQIQFLKIKKPKLPKKTPYPDAYKHGMVINPYRNKALCEKIAEFVEQNKKVVVLVKEIEHGNVLDDYLWKFKQKSFIPHHIPCH